jgi:hypothetical protein
MGKNPLREEILRRIDLFAEFQKHGGRVPPGARPSADDWIPVHSIDREDERPISGVSMLITHLPARDLDHILIC